MGAGPAKIGILGQNAEFDLVLASTSTVRARLLAAAGVPFRVRPSGFDEGPMKRELRARAQPAGAAAAALAQAKAMAVAEPTALVLGADQILSLDGAWFDKPADRAEAKAGLLRLAGRTHELESALVVMRQGEVLWRHAETARLTMRAFDAALIEAYLDAAGADALTSVGAYQVEGVGVQLFDKIEGDFFAILGLPLVPLLGFLRGWRR